MSVTRVAGVLALVVAGAGTATGARGQGTGNDLRAMGQAAGAATQGAGTQAAATQGGARKVGALELQNPRAVAVDEKGTLYVVDVGTEKIYKITTGGEVSMAEGTAGIGAPISVWVGKDGSMAVADLDSNVVYRISAKGEANTIGRPTGEGIVAGTSAPAGAVVDSKGNVFIADNKNATVIKVTPEGESSVFAGKVDSPGMEDGKGGEARFSTPRGIAIDAMDNLYVADEGNSNIRKITPEGVVTTLAGGEGAGGTEDGTGKAAKFAAPRGLAVDKEGTVYVADTDNHTVRKVTPAGVVTTIGGKAGEAGDANGAAAVSRFNSPRGVAVDGAGNVYVADSENGAVREISPEGVVRTVAGLGAK
jgi:sugar lactone lactonase YvrE